MHICEKIMHVTYRSQKREDFECNCVRDAGGEIAREILAYMLMILTNCTKLSTDITV